MIALFTKHRKFSLFSWLIQVFEGSRFSHVAIMYKDRLTDTWLVAHSTRFRLNVMSLENFQRENEIIEQVYIKKELTLKLQFLDFLYKNLGAEYGYATVVGVLFARIFKIKNPFRDNDKTLVCSEFVIKALGLTSIDPEVDGPQKVFEKLKEQ